MTQPIAIVLAAGKGTRMDTDRPKVLCEALGRPLIDYVIDALASAGVGRIIVVVGYRADDVRQALATRENLECDIEFVDQTEQLGTGHAVMVCQDLICEHNGPVLVLAGDSPLVQPDSIRDLLAEFSRTQPACILGTLHKQDPKGLGRILRDDAGGFLGIIEEKDATLSQRRITEVNMSTYVFDCGALVGALSRLTAENQQQEYYLTDCPGMLKAEGHSVIAMPVLRPCESLSVNTVIELAAVEAEMQRLGY